MKKITLIVTLCLVLFTSVAFTKQYTDAWGPHGFSLNRQSGTGISINFSIQEYFTSDKEVDGETLQSIHIPGVYLPNNEGAPDLPGMSRYIAIPEGASVSFNIVDYRTELIPNMDIAPAPRIPLDTEDGPLDYNKDMQIFSKNEFYPSEPIVLSDVRQIRGVDVVILGITPFQYNPVTKEMIVYRDIDVELEFHGGTGHFGDDRLRSPWWDPIYRSQILNYESIPEKDYSYSSNRDDGCDYLIVVPDHPDFIAWADSIKNFRQKQGIITQVVTLTDIGANNANTIESYINNAYNTWDPAPSAVLLLADYGTGGTTGTGIISPNFSNCVSDNIYADVDGDDLPEIHFARITARNASELEITISKFLDNENDPPTNPTYYNNPISCCGWQTERWFQICSETVGGFWNNELGKLTTRINEIYSGNPNGGVWSTATNTSTVVNYFGPNGLGYIPADPSTLGGWSGGSASQINAAINAGAFMLQHRDHGGVTGWGEPNYGNSDLAGLTNDDLVFIFSINCLTGKYNSSSECFAEACHRYEHRALGVIAASETSYSFVNDTYVWGMYDLMWPNFMPDYGAAPSNSDWIYPCMGNSAGKIFLEGSSWPYNTNNKQITYYLFHHHGDAFMTVYSEMPQYLTVTHDAAMLSGVASFDVTADVGANIAITVDGEIIGTGVGTGIMPTSIPIDPQLPGNVATVTVVKQNYYRYSQAVNIIPPSGPYVIYENHGINDSSGNGNGEVDYGENILLDLTLKNVGVQNADNVIGTLSTINTNINFSDDSENFGTIPASQSVTADDAYEFTVSNSITDQEIVAFDVSVDGDPGMKDTWETSFGIVVNAPLFEIGGLTINDSNNGNGNGRLDPGETVNLIVDVTNNGHADSPDADGTLICNNNYITVNSSTHAFGSFIVGQTKTAVFNITVAGDTPTGVNIPLEVNVTGGNYSDTEMFYEYVGLAIEDFETGDFSSYDWSFGGNADWIIDTESPYEGTYCAKSGSISHQETTELSITLDTGEGDISFWRKVSSENNYDYLEFYIDGAMQDHWAGSQGWAEVSYPVDSGTHTFIWIYDKDYTVSGGEDCAWIDYITFPPILSPFPIFYLSPSSLDFGEVQVGQDSTKQFTIYNLGGQTLSGSIETPDCFTVAEAGTTPRNTLGYSIPMGESITYDLTFSPENAMSYDGEVQISIDPFAVEYLEIFATGIPQVSNDDNTYFAHTLIHGSFPNPTKGSTVIKYQLKGPASMQDATIRIYNIHGNFVKEIHGTGGNAQVDISDMATGMYFYKLVNQDYDEVKKMILVK